MSDAEAAPLDAETEIAQLAAKLRKIENRQQFTNELDQLGRTKNEINQHAMYLIGDAAKHLTGWQQNYANRWCKEGMEERVDRRPARRAWLAVVISILALSVAVATFLRGSTPPVCNCVAPATAFAPQPPASHLNPLPDEQQARPTLRAPTPSASQSSPTADRQTPSALPKP